MLRQHLDSCLVYYGWSGFLIRPYIPPTFEHAHLIDAKQRVYISATLGEGGELERAFGRELIKRVPIPPGWEERASGRRFFLFPDLVQDVESSSLVKELIRLAGKALVISPSDRQLKLRLESIVPDDVPIVQEATPAGSVERFRSEARGVVGLANRYDGIDLADDACRITVLDGLPAGEHLQERFLVRSIRASRVLEERLRTRVMQGAGRSTRGLQDHSIVVVLGDDITRFLQKREVQRALRAEPQAEVQFGIENSNYSQEEITEIVASFLAQDDDWRTDAEDAIAEAKHEAERVLPPGTADLAASAPKEVVAWSQLWRGDHGRASQTAAEVAEMLAHPDLSPYRSLWLYFASAWRQVAAESEGSDSLMHAAGDLLEKAHEASRSSTWLRELAPLPKADTQLEPIDEVAIQAIADNKLRTVSLAKFTQRIELMLSSLRETEAKAYERGLETLGDMLGALGKKADRRRPCGLRVELRSSVGDDRSEEREEVQESNRHR